MHAIGAAGLELDSSAYEDGAAEEPAVTSSDRYT
jgi:hypothetical protein